jgi:hypothetical protein
VPGKVVGGRVVRDDNDDFVAYVVNHTLEVQGAGRACPHAAQAH